MQSRVCLDQVHNDVPTSLPAMPAVTIIILMADDSILPFIRTLVLSGVIRCGTLYT
jgi:hypothetical protein